MNSEASVNSERDDLIARVAPALEEIDKRRIEHIAEYEKRRMPMYLGIGGAAVLGLLIAAFANLVFGAFAGIGISSLVWNWAQGPARAYRREYKTTLLPKIANGIGDFQYGVASGISMTSMDPSGIIPRHHRYHHEDHFTGRYNDVGVEFCEGKLQVRRRSRRRTYYQTVFQGLMVRLEMPKPFEGRTVVRRDAGAFNWVQRLGPLERIRLEDPEFERQFEVHGNDQIEARRLLTPAFMERLKRLVTAVGAQSMECAFFENKLLILMPHSGAMSSSGLLEPGPLTQPAQNEAVVRKIADEFARICGVVDELKLAEQKRPATSQPTSPT